MYQKASFAKLCGTTKRTLQHYETIGLFHPAYVDEKGYRYYSHEQYDVFLIINSLREIGMSLTEIKNYMDTRSPEKLEELLKIQRKQVEKEIMSLQQIQNMIDTRLELLEEAKKIEGKVDWQEGDVYIEEIQEEYLVLSAEIHSNAEDVYRLALYEHLAACRKQHYDSGHPFGALLSTETVQKGDFRTYQNFFMKVGKPVAAESCRIKPAGTYAVVYLRGDYLNADYAFQMILKKASTESWKLGDAFYKEGILDEVVQRERKDYLTKISVQIKYSPISHQQDFAEKSSVPLS